ncbi:MAG: methylated-DNA--[protein]-cysteine S-methyltransferase [Verrucomicrobia bacterium]|nr:MAG: methylated-DNA--[protein]-cysteine S-methyltransferase [Verrucomicrobiota bacterium]
MTASSRLDLVTTWGVIGVQAQAGALTSCTLPVPRGHLALRVTTVRLHCPTPADCVVLRQAERCLRVWLRGREPSTLPPLKPAARTAFTARVLTALQKIPRGVTVTYGELARRIGAPRAARAVGTACGVNPLPLFIPCHRVVAAGGKLGGFSAGVEWKRFLLTKERAVSKPWKNRSGRFPRLGNSASP